LGEGITRAGGGEKGSPGGLVAGLAGNNDL
jgi:hypothetical protein